jgi:hypothetical protein
MSRTASLSALSSVKVGRVGHGELLQESQVSWEGVVTLEFINIDFNGREE